MASTLPILGNEIWVAIFEQLHEEFPTRLSALRLVAHFFNELIIPICYRDVYLGDRWTFKRKISKVVTPLQREGIRCDEVVGSRVMQYTRHLTFSQRRPGVLPDAPNLRIQELLENCQRIKKISYVFETNQGLNYDRATNFPIAVREFLVNHPDVKLDIKGLNYARVSGVPDFKFLAPNLTCLHVYNDGQHIWRELKLLLHTCTNLDNLEVEFFQRHNRLWSLRYMLGPFLPPVKRLKISTLCWNFNESQVQNTFDFSRLEEFSIITSENVTTILALFHQVFAPKLKVFRYTAYRSAYTPPAIKERLQAQLNENLALLVGLQVLELKCDAQRIHLPSLLQTLPNIRELDLGRHFGFLDKALGSTMLGVEDIACLQKLDRLECLSLDLERDFCDTYEFLSNLCEMKSLRSLTIRTQTIKHGEYSTIPCSLDVAAREIDEAESDRWLAWLMTEHVHKVRSHRLASLKLKLGGFDESLDWEVREVPMTDGVLERRFFAATWNLWGTANVYEFEERRGRKVVIL